MPAVLYTKTKVDQLLTPGPWTSVTPAEGWVADYAGAYGDPGFRLMPGGWVAGRGLMRRASGATTIMFTLPASARPSEIRSLAAVSGNQFCELIVNPNGDVAVNGGAPGIWVSLAGLIFTK